jgi:hypothetical protein
MTGHLSYKSTEHPTIAMPVTGIAQKDLPSQIHLFWQHVRLPD